MTRVEAQCRRNFLRSMQVETISDMDRTLPDIWTHFTSWLTLRDQNNDRNRLQVCHYPLRIELRETFLYQIECVVLLDHVMQLIGRVEDDTPLL